MRPTIKLLNDQIEGGAQKIRELAVEWGGVIVNYQDRHFEFDAFDGEDVILAELEKATER